MRRLQQLIWFQASVTEGAREGAFFTGDSKVTDSASLEVAKTRRQLFFEKAIKWAPKVFFILYGGLLLLGHHFFSVGLMSWQSVIGLAAFALVAFFVHTKHGKFPSLLIAVHMGMEWYHHALHVNHYGIGEIVFYGVHALGDAVFLTFETKEHYKKRAKWFLLAILVILVGIFAYYYVPAPTVVSFAKPFAMPPGMEQVAPGHSHAHDGGPFHTAVLGGILGCLVFQLLSAFGWKHGHGHGKQGDH